MGHSAAAGAGTCDRLCLCPSPSRFKLSSGLGLQWITAWRDTCGSLSHQLPHPTDAQIALVWVPQAKGSN